MSAKSRSRKFVQLPLRRGDFIISMFKMDEKNVAVGTDQGRLFMLERVARYKRLFKVRELTRP